MPPARKTIGLSELRVGLLVLISIAIFIFLILNATGDINPFARKLHLKAQFANAEGLREGADVRLAGVKVGKVDEVRLLPPSDDPNAPKVEAIMAIDSKIDGQPAQNRIRKDSTVQLSSSSILGSDVVLNIVPGTTVSEPVTENYTLPASASGGFNDLATSGNDLVQRLNKISDQVNAIVNKVNEGKGTLGRVVNDEALYDNLNSAIRDTQGLINQINRGQGSAGKFVNDPALYNNLNSTVAQLESIAQDLRAGHGTAGKLFTDEALYNEARSTVTRLNQSADQINGMIADIRAGRGTVGKLITDEQFYNDARTAIAHFNTTAERIDNVVANAQRGEGTLGKLLTDDQLYSNVNQLSSEGVKLVYDFRQNPKKYLTIKFQLF
jgi:phospholipid/cholesterol/gamma-HCH transport system substrate-binding protein